MILDTERRLKLARFIEELAAYERRAQNPPRNVLQIMENASNSAQAKVKFQQLIEAMSKSDIDAFDVLLSSNPPSEPPGPNSALEILDV